MKVYVIIGADQGIFTGDYEVRTQYTTSLWLTVNNIQSLSGDASRLSQIVYTFDWFVGMVFVCLLGMEASLNRQAGTNRQAGAVERELRFPRSPCIIESNLPALASAVIPARGSPAELASATETLIRFCEGQIRLYGQYDPIHDLILSTDPGLTMTSMYATYTQEVRRQRLIYISTPSEVVRPLRLSRASFNKIWIQEFPNFRCTAEARRVMLLLGLRP